MAADPIVYDSRPSLRHPVLILAFSGWSDAGAAASAAVRYLTDQVVATKFASIDPEDFYDFSVQRPQVRLNDQIQRQIFWPSYDFYYGAGIGTQRDFVFGLGPEPHLHWKAFCNLILEVTRDLSFDLVVTLGAYLDEVLYTRPVPLTGFSTDERILTELDLIPSRYQGPTGIVGVLGEACRRAGVPYASIWAALPHYLPASPNARGALALVLRLTQWLGLPLDTSPLERAAADFQGKVNEAVNNDANLSAFIRELKKREFEQ